MSDRETEASSALPGTSQSELPVVLLALARSIEEQTRVLRRIQHAQEILVEAMPATTEAQLLRISERTVRRNRKRRQAERLIHA